MKFEIRNRWSGEIVFSVEADSWRVAIEAAYKAKADLCGANLCEADLRGANLRGADLRGADLCGADLRGADLCGADLCGADLRGADLREAKNLERFPISILGHKHGLFTTMDGHLAIGCHVHSFDEWTRHAEKIGSVEGYSSLDVEIYKLHIQHIQKVSQLLWNAKKEEKAEAVKA